MQPINRVESVKKSIHGDNMVAESLRLEIFALDNSRCIVCGWNGVTPKGTPILEAAHVMAEGKAKGPNEIENLLSMCPTCHTMFDRYCFSFEPDMREIEINPELTKIYSSRFDSYTVDSISRIHRGYLEHHYLRFKDY